MFRDLGDRYAQAPPLHNIGYSHHHLGRYDLAVCYYRQTLDLLREFGDRYNQAFALTHLGESYLAVGDQSAAHDAWQQALAILQELDHADAEQVQNKLAQFHTPTDDRLREQST